MRVCRRTSSAPFVQLFDDAPDRATVIVTFLAILEMVRVRTLKIYQKQIFGTIHVMRLANVE